MRDQLFDLHTYIAPDVVEAYKAFQPSAFEWWSNPQHETSNLGLDRTTARAVSTGIPGERGPIAIYEAWAALQLARVTSDATLQASLGTREGFESWHADLTASLVAHWQVHVTENNDRLRRYECEKFIPANPALSIAHRCKMVDLFVKYLRVKADTHPGLARCCYEFGHIPLDRKSLAVISAAFSGIGMARDFSMGDIVSETMYQTAQRLARAICVKAGGTPLLLDVFAWHAPYAQRLYAKREQPPSRKSESRRKNKAQASAAA
jgi:hypothetical protein